MLIFLTFLTVYLFQSIIWLLYFSSNSGRHMFGWNTLGLPLMGPAVATHRFFDTLNRVERVMNQMTEEEATE